MANFIPSFQAGIDQARSAERNRAEIDSVFADLNAQLSGATQGKLLVQREQFSEQADSPLETFSLKPRPKYWAITVRHNSIPTLGVYELARWNQPIAGYPCRIERDGRMNYCENKEALEKALAALLSNAAVGDTFYKLMQA